MKNLCIELTNDPGALADMGEILGRAGISIEGGGAFVVDGKGVANFLFEDGPAARHALESAGIRGLRESDVVVQKLNQDQPGQLGKLMRRMADAGINVETQYSDHAHQLILVVDDPERARTVSEAWMRERDVAQPPAWQTRPGRQHEYSAKIEWTGNTGLGTKNYAAYRRDYSIRADGKVPIEGSSDPAFRGDATRYNPEELLVAALSSCHMLWYLHLCAVNKVVVTRYEDAPAGTMIENPDGSGRFAQATLNPVVTIESGSNTERARALHDEAHRKCFIANSVSFPVQIKPQITVASPPVQR